MIVTTKSPEETRKCGFRLGSLSKPGDVYALEGELGCGKTEFVRGFADFYGVASMVKSPTFTIINIYKAENLSLYHFDFYRMKKSTELYEIGFEEYINSQNSICLIEWANLFAAMLPQTVTHVTFRETGPMEREIEGDPLF